MRAHGAILACFVLAGCAAAPPPPVKTAPPCPSARTSTLGAGTTRGHELAALPFHDAALSAQTVRSWTDADRDAREPGAVLGVLEASGVDPITFPYNAIAYQPDFAVDLKQILVALEARARASYAGTADAMDADLRAREALFPEGSTVPHRDLFVRADVVLAVEHDHLTVNAWWTKITRCSGPLVRAPQAHCAPGQPCAQMADYRPDLSARVTYGMRWIVTADGTLRDEVIFAARGEGP